MTKTVIKFQAEFVTGNGKSYTMSVTNPKSGLTELEMEAFARNVIASTAIQPDGTALTKCTGLKVVETTEEVVETIDE